jgi:hypothetical protein
MNDLKIEDLAVECPECKGQKPPQTTLQFQNSPQPESCRYCRGKGKELTPAGEVLKEFMKHYLDLPTREERKKR